MAGVLARVRSVMESSPFLRHVLTLVSGTATAQAIVFGMTMILTRIFSDADLGQLTRYTSVVSIITAVAALRYDMTIMLPKKDAWALACARLGMVCIVVVSIISSVVALLLKPLVTRYWGADIAAWMPLLGVTTLLLLSLIHIFTGVTGLGSVRDQCCQTHADQCLGRSRQCFGSGRGALGGSGPPSR